MKGRAFSNQDQPPLFRFQETLPVLRILYLTPDLFGLPGGIARYCRMVCRALVESQCQVTTIALLDDPAVRREARTAFPSIRYSSCHGNRRQFVYRALRAARTRPDVILVGHAHFAPLGWLLARLTGARLVTFIYGVEVWNPLSPARQRALCASDLLISISRFTANQAAQANGISLQATRLLPNCVDPILAPSSNTAASQTPTSRQTLSLLTVSRILRSEMYKGHEQVIRALPALLQRFPDLVYDVVGDGDGRSEMEELAVQQGVAGAVRFHGVVSDDDVARFYAGADVFTMPSQREGFGFVFIEAMSYGKPVVAGNQDASPEVVSDGETGFCVDPTSVETVGAALARLLENSDLRGRMGEAGKRRVEDLFGFARFHEQLQAFLAPAPPGEAPAVETK